MKKWFEKPVVAFTLINGLAILIYLNSLHAPFYFDDVLNIVSNPALNLNTLSLSGLKKAFIHNRPVTNLSFGINHYLGGFDTLGYHTVNLALHGLTGCAIYLFIVVVLGRSSSIAALIGSLLWVAHPIHTESVTYIVQRATVLSTLFLMIAVLLYTQAKLWDGWKRLVLYSGLLVCGALALGSKEIAASLPMILVLYEYYFGPQFNTDLFKRHTLRTVSAFATVIIILVLYVSFQLISGRWGVSSIFEIFTKNYATENYPVGEKILTEFRVLIFYFSLLLLPLPSRLNIQHDFSLSISLFSPVTTFLSFISVLGLILYALKIRKEYPVISFGIVWFFITIAMETFIFRLDLVYEHRLYLPSIGLTLIFCFLLQKVLEQKNIFNFTIPRMTVLGFCVMAIGLYSIWTIQRNVVWQDDITMWRDVIQKSPTNTKAYTNLGTIYLSKGQVDLAVSMFQEAVRLNPKNSLYRENLGIAYEKQGRQDLALALFEKAVQMNPEDVLAYYDLGRIYLQQDRLEEAKAALNTSIRLAPGLTRAYFLLGSTLDKLGQLQEATLTYEKLLILLRDVSFEPGVGHKMAIPKVRPDKPGVQYALGQIYEKQGKADQAVYHYQEALNAMPDFLPVQYDLARLYVQQRKFNLAQGLYQEILKQDPSRLETHFYLAFVYELNGDSDLATVHYKQFLDLTSGNPAYEDFRLMAKKNLSSLVDFDRVPSYAK